MHPQPEEYWGKVNPIGFRSCYDEGKRCAETLFFDYWRQHSLRIKVARIFNTYGPRMRLMNIGDEATGPINLGNPGEYTWQNPRLGLRDQAANWSASRCPRMIRAKGKPILRLPKKEWNPQVNLEGAREETINYYRSML